MTDKMINECYEKAKEVIRQCSTKHGLFASAGKHGYDAIWARDSMISFLGASLVKSTLLKNTFKQSLVILADNQSRNGQIPNAVDKFSKRKKHVDFASIDSSLWYIIGHCIYFPLYGFPTFNAFLGLSIFMFCFFAMFLSKPHPPANKQ